MAVDAKAIYDSISELIIACETIRNASRCDRCPLYKECLVDSTFEDIAYKVKPEAIRKTFHLADDITEDEEERAKTEDDRAWEAEADYWNDRRCDPDYE